MHIIFLQSEFLSQKYTTSVSVRAGVRFTVARPDDIFKHTMTHTAKEQKDC